MRIKGSSFALWIISIAFLTLCIIELSMVWNNTSPPEKWSEKAFYLSIVSLAINAVLLIHYKVKVTEFPFVMSVLSYLFMFGRVWLNYWGEDSRIYWVLHKFYDGYQMQRVSILVVCCVHVLIMGMLIAYSKQEREYIDSDYDSSLKDFSEKARACLYSTGILLLVIGMPCRIITDIQACIATSVSKDYASVSASSGIIDDFAFLYVPGLLCIMESRPRLKKPLFIILCIYFLVIMTLTGDRRYYVSAILAFAVYVFRDGLGNTKKRKPIKIILLLIAVIVFMNFLEVIRSIRQGNLTSVLGLLSGYGMDLFLLDDFFFNVLAEFGISFYSVVSIVTCIPSVFPFQYGLTILRTIPSVLPLGFVFGEMFSQASPSTYVNPYLGRPVGATVFGDLYSNFGVFCILATFIVGIVLGRVFRKEKAVLPGYPAVMYYTYFYILINLVRCSIFEMFRPMIWCSIIPMCVFSILKKQRNM